MTCPKCGFDQADRAECARCGVVFSKVGRRPLPEIFDGRIANPTIIEDESVRDGLLGRRELIILASGLAAAIVIYAVPFLRFIFWILKTLFHEFSHAVVGWLLGHPGIPAFDFVYGGGFTHQTEFQPSVAIAIGLGLAWSIWHFRQNRKATIILSIIAAVWLIVVISEWRRETAIAFAGHAGELTLAGIFLYMALSGVGLRLPDIERPLAAFAAFFVPICTIDFAWKLIHDPDYLEAYRAGKDGGGALMNDLEVVALNIQIHTGINMGIEGAAKMLIAFSILPTAIALLWYLKRAQWHRMLRSLRTVDA